MATQKFSGPINVGATQEIPAMTNMAVVGIILVGQFKLEMVEPSSSKPVKVLDGTEVTGAFDVRQVGTILRLTNTGTFNGSASVFEA